MKQYRLKLIHFVGALNFLSETTTEAFFVGYHKPKSTARVTTTTCQFWSRSAAYQENENEGKQIFIQSTDRIEPSLTSSQSSLKKYNLASPRDWLEKQEETHGDILGKEGGGAYTVIRCDFCIPRIKHIAADDEYDNNSNAPNNGRWKVWGKEFHMKRLQQSYQLLVENNSDGTVAETLDAANEETWNIIQTLLSEAKNEILHNIDLPVATQSDSPGGNDEAEDFFTLMVTLLWQPSSNLDSKIEVLGHACTAGQFFSSPDSYDPLPISVCLAIENNVDWNEESPLLPNRYEHIPKAKLSSWCRRRRPLEEQFKVHNVGEVLLTAASRRFELPPDKADSSSDDYNKVAAVDHEHIHILEGLTSNFFVIYPNGKLRTANSGVLEGYARDLVISCAEKCGLQVEVDNTHPIKLTDAPLWEEAFITSSVSIIKPIEKVYIPTRSSDDSHNNPSHSVDGDSMHVLWSAKEYSENNGDSENDLQPKWKAIYREIMKASY